jgi:hypothetical protein
MDDPDVELPRLLFCDSEKGRGTVSFRKLSRLMTALARSPPRNIKKFLRIRRRYIPWRRRLAISKNQFTRFGGFFIFGAQCMANIEKLGSSSPEVLLKNATNLDKLVNGRESESLPDRFGVLRKTWHGMEMIFSRFIDYITGRGEQAVAAIGWQELGNWAVGLAVDNRQQIVYYNGSWYKYLGELEHVIAGDSPENDGGVWSAANPTGKWSNIGDAALRSNLGSGEGFSLVGKCPNIPPSEPSNLPITGSPSFLAAAMGCNRQCHSYA